MMMMSPNTHAINQEQSDNVWNLYHTHPVVGVCVSAIKNSMMTQEICGLDGMEKELRVALTDVASSALEWIVCIGVVPIVIKRRSEAGSVTVHIPDRESVNIYVTLDKLGKKSFSACFKHETDFFVSGASESNILVWTKTDNVPDANGMLTTPITRLEASERFSKFLMQRVMIAESLRANPYHVTQARVKQNNDTDGVMWNVGDNIVEAAERSRIDHIENAQFHQYTMHSDKWGESIIANDNETNDLLKNMCQPREYYLSAERELVRPQPVLSSLNELQNVMKSADERIYQILGVPMSMFAETTGHTVNSNSMAENIYNSTLMKHQKCIELLLNDVNDLTMQLSKEPREKTLITLDSLPFLRLEHVSTLVDHGVITRDEVTHLVRQHLLLPKVGKHSKSTCEPEDKQIKSVKRQKVS